MERSIKKLTGSLVLVAALAALAGAAHAQSPSITVNNDTRNGNRRLEIVIQDAAPVSETSSFESPEIRTAAVNTPPDGGQIQGTMVVGKKHYAVTANRLLTVGDAVAGHKIVEVTLDHVRISRGARSYELTVADGQWAAGGADGAAE
jgi:hypothetical protein